MIKIKSGKIIGPITAMIYGTEGVGKTTLASQLEKPLILDVEGGSNNLNVDRVDPSDLSSYDKIIQCLDYLKDNLNGYKTIVIDSIDAVESLVFSKIKEETGKTVALAFNGYGKGYACAYDFLYSVRTRLSAISESGVNVVVIAHERKTKIDDPVSQSQFDQYEPKLYKSNSMDFASIFTEWVDSVFFVTTKKYTGIKDGGEKGYASSTGERVIYTEERPSHKAKNRFGLPSEIDFLNPNIVNTFDLIIKMINDSREDVSGSIVKEIGVLLESVDDTVIKSSVITSIKNAKSNKQELERIKDKLMKMKGAA